MHPLDMIALTSSSLTKNRLRGVLTTLGIVIGVAAVIVMIGIGEGSKKATQDIIRSMGTNVIIVHPSSHSRAVAGPLGLGAVPTLTFEDAEAIQRELKDTVAAATPVVRSPRPAVYQNTNWLVGTVLGVNPMYPSINPWNLEKGRYFSDEEVRNQAKVCVLGKTVQENLFLQGEDPIGKTIRIGKLPFEVVGVLERKGGGPRGDQDDTIHAPYTTVMRKVMGRDRIQQIAISVAREDLIVQAEAEITTLLRQRHRLKLDDENDFNIHLQQDWLDAAAEQSGVITMLLGIAAAISLVVGGVGISNVMLVAVTERTQEIGLRRSVGATQRNVMFQFFFEALALSVSGGVLGIGLAFASLWILQKLGLQALTQGWAVALGFGFSFLVGTAAGFFPALKAAKLSVIDAIRSE
ncbi:MAG: ABC transporter permease [Holophagaceae bacterium]|nr:ABC transporter permease [Holophagaceae bacterium]